MKPFADFYRNPTRIINRPFTPDEEKIIRGMVAAYLQIRFPGRDLSRVPRSVVDTYGSAFAAGIVYSGGELKGKV